MERLTVSALTLGALGTNCYILANEETKEALIFDPADEAQRIGGYLEEHGLKAAGILLTHGHADHIGGAEELREMTGAKIYALDEEESLLQSPKSNLSLFIQHKAVTVKADEFLHDGQELTLAGIRLKVYHTPGHTPGGCSYYCQEADCVFSGDTLFEGSVGRTDFPGGSMSRIVRSVKEKLLTLPPETKVYPGHGGTTTVEYEKNYNPFI